MGARVQEAAAARESTDGYKLDKAHTLAVNLFDEIDKYLKIPDEYQSPEQKAYVPQVRPFAPLPFRQMMPCKGTQQPYTPSCVHLQ